MEDKDTALLKEVDEGLVFNIQHYSIHDGPGIRTLVFLKGCPLRCRWCCNPESMSSVPELSFRKSFCNGCGRCLEACPQHALSLIEEPHIIAVDYALCDNCGACVEFCLQDALTVYGRKMTTAEVMDEVSKDQAFYRRSGGGVTFSGGEPTRQAGFLINLLRHCRQLGIHTAIETSGYCNSRIFKAMLEEVDLVMFDLKMMDSEQHLALTDKSNRLILNNARLLAKAKCAVQFRMPLVPGVNDTEGNISRTASFLKSLGLPSIELMPYHEFGKNKYQALGRPYNLPQATAAKPEHQERARKMFESYGVECLVSI